MRPNQLTSISIENFTAFTKLEVAFSKGINAFIGANATGKTHLLKILYSCCSVPDAIEKELGAKLAAVFMPHKSDIRRLVRRGSMKSTVNVISYNSSLLFEIVVNSPIPWDCKASNPSSWTENTIINSYIPPKDMLANAPGFRSLYNLRKIHFEAVYVDLLDRAYLDPPREETIDENLARLCGTIEDELDGTVTRHNEDFFLKPHRGDLEEFMLAAEGLRKLGLLWLLIRNGSISEGSILFWDEPESNLNPGLISKIIDIMLELQRHGVQIFLATHNYVVLKQLDLRSLESDKIRYHSLYREDSGEILYETADDIHAIDRNPIIDTMADIYDREVERALGGKK
jgi:predicted ATPase